MQESSHGEDRPVTRSSELQSRAADLLAYVRSFPSGGEQPSFREAERHVRRLVRAIEGSATAAVLERFEPETDVVEHEGRAYRRMTDPSESTYQGMPGGFRVSRHLYRQIGVRNGPTIVPLDLRAGIVEGLLTPEAAQASAHLMQSLPSREAEETARRMGVLWLSRTTLARTAEAMGRRWEDNRLDAEDHLLATLDVPEEAAAVSVSVDRVSVPMEEPRPRPPGRPRKGAPKNPIEVAYRMAYCAVLTLHDSSGEPLHSTRYARMPGEGASRQIESSMVGDLHGLLAERADLQVVTLADGAPEMQNMLDRVTSGLQVHAQLVDFWHLLEKLAAAIAATGRDAKPKLAKWRAKLKEDDDAIERIEVELRTWALDYTAVPAALHDALTYIDNRRERMRYASPRAAGLPIGSGHVEATCKTIVSTRMKRCGARWKTPGGQSIMHLRSLATSSRWEDGMDFLLGTYSVDPAANAAAA